MEHHHRRDKHVKCSCYVGQIVGILCLIFFCTMRSIPAGHVGVLSRFGYVYPKEMSSGLHFVNPLSKIHIMSTRTQLLPYSRSVLSSEGLTIDIVLALQYSLEATSAAKVLKNVGEDYTDVIITPVLSSVIREIASKRDAKAMYTSETRVEMHKELRVAVNDILQKHGIIVHDVLLRDVILPEKLKAAIESKLGMEQESERMKFVLSKEAQEAERKEIEAKGIQKFQEIVSKGIDEHLLNWKGIEATLRLAESTNSKVVVVGNSANGLPVIYDV